MGYILSPKIYNISRDITVSGWGSISISGLPVVVTIWNTFFELSVVKNLDFII